LIYCDGFRCSLDSLTNKPFGFARKRHIGRITFQIGMSEACTMLAFHFQWANVCRLKITGAWRVLKLVWILIHTEYDTV